MSTQTIVIVIILAILTILAYNSYSESKTTPQEVNEGNKTTTVGDLISKMSSALQKENTKTIKIKV